MTKIRIVYNDEMNSTASPHDDNGTNGFTQSIDHVWNGLGQSLTFTLRDTKIAQQFVEVWNLNKIGYDGKDTEFKIEYNEFSNINLETRMRMQQDMNNVIDTINSMTTVYPIDESLKLEISDAIQVDKLNTLHRYFEDTSYALISSKEIRDSDLHNSLEIINQLVHRMEGISCPYLKYFTVIRNLQKIDLDCIYKLQDSDYNLFEIQEQSGVLFLDFATVGKDLGACFQTNDATLVHEQEVKQQLNCMPYFNFTFNSGTEDYDNEYWKKLQEATISKYHAWCDENEVKSYYDYTKPMYNLGRVPIGDIDNDVTTEVYDQLISNCPYITGVYLEK